VHSNVDVFIILRVLQIRLEILHVIQKQLPMALEVPSHLSIFIIYVNYEQIRVGNSFKVCFEAVLLIDCFFVESW